MEYTFDGNGHYQMHVYDALSGESSAWILITCAQVDTFSLTENQFSDNCDIFSIQPTIEEWAEWISLFSSPAVVNPIKAYIEAKKPSVSFDQWQRIMDALDSEEVESVKQMQEDDFIMVVQGSVPGFQAKELWGFIQSAR